MASLGNGAADELRGEQSWKRHPDPNWSAVVDLFHGQYRSRLTCPDCGRVTVVFDPFLLIALPIRPPNLVHVRISLTLFDFFAPIQHRILPIKTSSIATVTATHGKEDRHCLGRASVHRMRRSAHNLRIPEFEFAFRPMHGKGLFYLQIRPRRILQGLEPRVFTPCRAHDDGFRH
jgi:hypothetical protein